MFLCPLTPYFVGINKTNHLAAVYAYAPKRCVYSSTQAFHDLSQSALSFEQEQLQDRVLNSYLEINGNYNLN